jgi:hypothetical protein
MTKEEYSAELKKYVPEGAASTLTNWIFKHHIQLSIARSRKTKLGDFRTNSNTNTLKISVNGNLNPYAFLITLTHEIAHALVHKKHNRRVKPHGVEWKLEYQNLMLIFFAKNVFPDDIARPLAGYMQNPKASSNADHNLYLALKSYDPIDESVTLLKDLNEGDEFILQNKLFKKGHKRRTRYSCIEVSSNREYTVNALAEVIPT